MLNIDTSKIIRQPAELLALVRAIEQAGKNDETYAIEWKGPLDLTTKPGIAHLVRVILGFANRDPATSAKTFGGYAYLVIGAEPGNICGTQELDLAQLDPKLRPYLGDAAGRWVAQWLPVDGKSVLVVIVDPPRHGDPSWPLRKEIDDGRGALRNGTIFVRHAASTEPASASDHDMLHRRLLAGDDQLEVVVTWAAQEPLFLAVDISDPVIERWISRERAALLAPLAPKQPASTQAMDAAIAKLQQLNTYAAALNTFGPKPEARSKERYQSEVSRYLSEAREVLPQAIWTAAARSEDPKFALEVSNLTDRNFADVEVKVHIGGPVFGFDRNLRVSEGDEFPPRPRLFGTPTPNPLFDFGSVNVPLSLLSPPPGTFRSGPIIENGGSVDVTFPAVSLRPHESRSLQPIVVLARADVAGEQVAVEWSCSAKDANGLLRGVLTASITTDAVGPDKLLTPEE